MVAFQWARFSGNSKTSDPGTGWGTSSFCVGVSSEAVEKSRSSRFLKSFRVLGAEGVGAVQMRMEWTLTWPVNLSVVKY